MLLSLFVLAAVLLGFTACSDMMEKLGNISLTIVLDTPDVQAASYSLEGLHNTPNTRFSISDITPPRHSLSSLKKGTWEITVKAFNADGDQIGAGTSRVDLKEGQIAETTLLVVFNQAVPAANSFTFAAPTRFDSFDGILSGTTANMEYRLASEPEDTPYRACTDSTTILGTGTYLLRYAAAHGLRASEPLRVTVPQYQPIQLTIADPTLTTGKIYDGTTEVSGTVTLGALSGVRETDTVTVSARTTYDDKSSGSGKTITLTYTLGGPDAGNYIKPVDKTMTGSIEKKPLTVSGTTITNSKVYDGETLSAVISHGALSGIVTGDTVTVSASAAYSDNSAGTDKTITVSYTLGDTDAANYLKPIDDSSFIGEITKKQLTVSGTEPILAKQYDGTPSAQLQNSGNLIGVVPGDAVTLQTTSTYSDTTIGNGKQITVRYAISGDTTNYLVPENATFNGGQITQKQLTVSNLALTSSKVYDGTTSVASPTFSFDGKVLGEDVRVTATATYDSPTAGNAKQITVAYALEGTDKGNYLKPLDPAATIAGVISKKQLTASGTELTLTKVYDGNTAAAITVSGTLSGIAAADAVDFSVTAAYTSETAGESKDIIVVYSLTGDAKDNYIKPESYVRSGVIQKRQLQVTTLPTVATTKTYDGTLGAEITQYSSLSGVILGDTVTLATTAAYVTKSAEIDKSIWVHYTIAGADKSNYIQPADVLATSQGVITKKQLTVTGTTITASKVYDGTTSAAVGLPGSLAGVVSGDSVYVSATAAYDTKAAGTGKPITLTYTLFGTDQNNYFKPVDSIASQAGVITPKQLDARIEDYVSTKVYDGTTSATAPQITLIGKLSPDTVTVTTTATYDSAAAVTNKVIGLVFTLSGDDKNNYLKPIDMVLTRAGSISKKQLTISAPTLETITKVYDGTTAVAGTVTPGTLSGVVEGEEVTVEAAASYQSANVTYGVSGGEFNPITVVYSLSGLNAINYYPPVNKQLWGAIVKKQLSVIDTVFPASKVYDKSSTITITSQGTLSGVIGSDVVSLSNVVAYFSGIAGDDVGTNKAVTINYTISGTDANNYYLNSDTSKTASITAAVLTATVGDYTQQYGSAVPAFTVNVTGFVAGDSATNIWGYTAPTATAGTNSSSAAGTYTIRISGGSAPNYSFTMTDTGTLTIQKPAGPAISGTIDGYYPTSNEDQTIVNVTGFTPNQTGIEAEIASYDTFIHYYPDFVIDSRGRTLLYLPSPASTTTKIRFRVKETSTHAPGPATEITLAPRPLAIGDYYEGGIVAFISTSTNLAEDTHGLIAAKSDISTTGLAWSSSTTTVVGTSALYGTGLSNSNKIMTSTGASSFSYAAYKARSYTGGGYYDWFLPSKDELYKMRLAFVSIGNFASPASFYWSSTEEKAWSREETAYTGDTVHAIEFDPNSGNTIMVSNSPKTYAYFVRPVRYF